MYGHKAYYFGHRRFLALNHALRSDETYFDGKTDFSGPPMHHAEHEISEMIVGIQTMYDKL
jgi:hypothetical protein